jgi:hypothetical protein
MSPSTGKKTGPEMSVAKADRVTPRSTAGPVPERVKQGVTHFGG